MKPPPIPEEPPGPPPVEDNRLEALIQDEIRRSVFERDETLKEKMKREQTQEINLDVLADLTDVVSSREIREIDRRVREKYRRAKGKDQRAGILVWVLILSGGAATWFSRSLSSEEGILLFFLAALLWFRKLWNAAGSGVLTRRLHRSSGAWSLSVFRPRICVRASEPAKFWMCFLGELSMAALVVHFFVVTPFGARMEKNDDPTPLRIIETESAAQLPGIPVRSVQEDEIPGFTAVHYVPLSRTGWTVSVMEYTLSGPREETARPVTPPGIYPLNQIAIDPEGPHYYGITTHRVGEIDIDTGVFHEMEIDPDLPELSWPSAIAFDTRRSRLIVTGRSGAYRFDLNAEKREVMPGFAGLHLLSLFYSEKEDLFYGAVDEPGARAFETVVRIGPHGAILSRIRLSHPLPESILPDGRLQLFKPSHDLIIFIPSRYQSGGRSGNDRILQSRLFLVNPDTGEIGEAEVDKSP